MMSNQGIACDSVAGVATEASAAVTRTTTGATTAIYPMSFVAGTNEEVTKRGILFRAGCRSLANT